MVKKVVGVVSMGEIDIINVEVLNEVDINKCVDNELKNIDLDNVDVIVEKNLNSDVCVLSISDEDFVMFVNELNEYYDEVNSDNYDVLEKLFNSEYFDGDGN